MFAAAKGCSKKGCSSLASTYYGFLASSTLRAFSTKPSQTGASRDYYDILGVSKGSSKAEIETAYRRLARQFHSDVNKEPSAEQKFKDIRNAYEVLSDDEKWKIYDAYGEAGLKGFGSGAGTSGFSNPFDIPIADAKSPLDQFKDWMKEYGKSYNSSAEFSKRFSIFKRNLKLFAEVNSKVDGSFELGLNEFSDLTTQEFAAIYLLPPINVPTKPSADLTVEDIIDFDMSNEYEVLSDDEKRKIYDAYGEAGPGFEIRGVRPGNIRLKLKHGFY